MEKEMQEELVIFYAYPFNFSYSSINKLLFSPKSFYRHYVLNQREDSVDAHLVGGKLLHCLILEPENFDDNFVILPGKVPKDNQRLVIDEVFKIFDSQPDRDLVLKDFSTEILNLMVGLDWYQKLKTDEQRLAKVLTPDNDSYFKFLNDKQGKSVIDPVIYANTKLAVDEIKKNKYICDLMQIETERADGIEVYNELMLTMPSKKLPFGFKGAVDNVVIDNNTKTIFITDLKTLGKNIQDFPDSVQYYKYWIQAVIYKHLVINEFLTKKELNVKEWNIVLTFVVIDKNNLVYPFQVSEESMKEWEKQFSDVLKEVSYHYVEKDYNLPYALACNTVKL
jgi:hypothetical protein